METKTLNKHRPELLNKIKKHNKKWFTAENKRFFGDKDYKACYGVKTTEAYLFQLTTCWSDMSDNEPVYRWRVHKINNYSIGKLLEIELKDWSDVVEWLENN